MPRTALSLFVDDTHCYPDGQFRAFVDFALQQGLRGKVSLMPGFERDPGQPPLGQTRDSGEEEFLTQMRRIAAGGFDVQMELMTHDKLWDFGSGKMRSGGPCEGIWLYDPKVPQADYAGYLSGILDAAGVVGIKLNGLSVPGCDCDDCGTRWAALQARGVDFVSDALVQAMLDLSRQGRFAGPVVPIYVDVSDADHPTRLIARAGECAIFDARLDMSVQDQIGFDGADADFYISADGKRGRIADLVLSGAEQCFFCAHWFSMNPEEVVGWAVFQEIILRINRTLGDRIEWIAPGAYGRRLLEKEREA
jgi:hypothetical protein